MEFCCKAFSDYHDRKNIKRNFLMNLTKNTCSILTRVGAVNYLFDKVKVIL